MIQFKDCRVESLKDVLSYLNNPCHVNTKMLTTESSKEKTINVHGSYAYAVSQALNEAYAKSVENKENEDEVKLGPDMDGETDEFQYSLRRKDVIDGIDTSQPTLKTSITIESLSDVNLQRKTTYDITNEIVNSSIKHDKNIILANDYRFITENDIENAKELIELGYVVTIILVVPNEEKFTEVQLTYNNLYDLVRGTNRLRLYLTYVGEVN